MEEPIPVKKTELYRRTSNNRGMVVDTLRAMEHVLNDVAMRIFELSDGESTLSDIAKTLTKEYDVDYETAHKDVVKTVKKLKELNVIAYKE